jgi:hypothetical protein
MLMPACAVVSASAQQALTQIGLLTCSVTKKSEAEGAPQRQTREVFCAFRPANSKPEETYTGTLEVVGPEEGLSEQRAMIWVVKGNRETIRSPGLLQQVYIADPTANPGHPSPLIGEANRSLVLQTLADSQSPAQIEAKPQATVAEVVVISLVLKSAPA